MRLGDYIGVDIMDDMYWELIMINKNINVFSDIKRNISWLLPKCIYQTKIDLNRYDSLKTLIELEIYDTYGLR
jgi:hypothetical protein